MTYYKYKYKDSVVTEQFLRSVWNKGRAIASRDAAFHRQDICGSWMQFDQHGHPGSPGEIRHRLPDPLSSFLGEAVPVTVGVGIEIAEPAPEIEPVSDGNCRMGLPTGSGEVGQLLPA